MKKIAIILGIIVLIALISLGVYIEFFNKEPVIDTPEPPPVDTTTPAEKIVIETATTKTETQKRNIDVNMPKFTNLSNFSFQENINARIAESIEPYIDEIVVVSDETSPSNSKYKYEVSYERYNNTDYISLVIIQKYSTGGMRSNEWKDTYTIDFANNKEVSLANVCSSENYKQIIVAEVNKQAKERELNLIAGNGLSNIPDSQRFYIKDEKLYIYFEPASIAPYLDGEMHFEMPFKYANGKFILE